jgi:hypothetical protein
MADYWDTRMLADKGEIDLIKDPLWWRKRAAEARQLAELCEDEISRNIMLRLAVYYDVLANGAND